MFEFEKFVGNTKLVWTVYKVAWYMYSERLKYIQFRLVKLLLWRKFREIKFGQKFIYQ